MRSENAWWNDGGRKNGMRWKGKEKDRKEVRRGGEGRGKGKTEQ